MIKVNNEVKVYERDGRETDQASTVPTILVESHWNRESMVCLRVGNERVTVVAHDLLAAIRNATNVNRF